MCLIIVVIISSLYDFDFNSNNVTERTMKDITEHKETQNRQEAVQ